MSKSQVEVIFVGIKITCDVINYSAADSDIPSPTAFYSNKIFCVIVEHFYLRVFT